MKTTFLYTLSDPETGKIRYLGKSDNPFKRYRKHLKDKDPSHKTNWITKLKSKGLVPYMDLLDEVPVSQWEFWEREYIRVFRAIGFDLVNICVGGRGPGSGEDNPFFGKKHTEGSRKLIREARAKQEFSEASNMARGAAMTGMGNHFFGKTHSDESLELMRAAQVGRDNSKLGREMTGDKNPFFGKKHSDKALQKMRKPKTEEHKKNLSASLIAYNRKVKI